MKRGTSRHPKLHHLMRLLSTNRRDAIGLLELLWEYTAEFAPEGDVGRWPNADIAGAVEWRANPDELIAALLEARWLDRDQTHRLIVHDWADHAPDYVKKRLARAGKGYVQPTADNGSQRPPVLSCPTQPNQVQPNPTQPEKDEVALAFDSLWEAYPDNNARKKAWDAWRSKEKAKGRPPIETILAALGAQKKRWRKLKRAKKFVPNWPYLVTWLNGKRWEDEPQEAEAQEPEDDFAGGF